MTAKIKAISSGILFELVKISVYHYLCIEYKSNNINLWKIQKNKHDYTG